MEIRLAMVEMAALMGLSPDEAVALPAVVAGAARKVGMADYEILHHAVRNLALRRHLADVTRAAASTLELD